MNHNGIYLQQHQYVNLQHQPKTSSGNPPVGGGNARMMAGNTQIVIHNGNVAIVQQQDATVSMNQQPGQYQNMNNNSCRPSSYQQHHPYQIGGFQPLPSDELSNTKQPYTFESMRNDVTDIIGLKSLDDLRQLYPTSQNIVTYQSTPNQMSSMQSALANQIAQTGATNQNHPNLNNQGLYMQTGTINQPVSTHNGSFQSVANGNQTVRSQFDYAVNFGSINQPVQTSTSSHTLASNIYPSLTIKPGSQSQQNFITPTHSAPTSVGTFRKPELPQSIGKRRPSAGKKISIIGRNSPSTGKKLPTTPSPKPAFTEEFFEFIQSPQVMHDQQDDEEDEEPFWVCDPEIWRKEQERLKNKNKSPDRHKLEQKIIHYSAETLRDIILPSVIPNTESTKPVKVVSSLPVSDRVAPSVTKNSRKSTEPKKANIAKMHEPQNVSKILSEEENLPKIVACYSLKPGTTTPTTPTTTSSLKSPEQLFDSERKKKYGCNVKTPLTKMISIPAQKSRKKSTTTKNVELKTNRETVSNAKAKVMAEWKGGASSPTNLPGHDRPHSTSPLTGSPLPAQAVEQRSRHISTELVSKKAKKKAPKKTRKKKSRSSSNDDSSQSPQLDSCSLESWFKSTQSTPMEMHLVSPITLLRGQNQTPSKLPEPQIVFSKTLNLTRETATSRTPAMSVAKSSTSAKSIMTSTSSHITSAGSGIVTSSSSKNTIVKSQRARMSIQSKQNDVRSLITSQKASVLKSNQRVRSVVIANKPSTHCNTNVTWTTPSLPLPPQIKATKTKVPSSKAVTDKLKTTQLMKVLQAPVSLPQHTSFALSTTANSVSENTEHNKISVISTNITGCIDLSHDSPQPSDEPLDYSMKTLCRLENRPNDIIQTSALDLSIKKTRTSAIATKKEIQKKPNTIASSSAAQKVIAPAIASKKILSLKGPKIQVPLKPPQSKDMPTEAEKKFRIIARSPVKQKITVISSKKETPMKGSETQVALGLLTSKKLPSETEKKTNVIASLSAAQKVIAPATASDKEIEVPRKTLQSKVKPPETEKQSSTPAGSSVANELFNFVQQISCASILNPENVEHFSASTDITCRDSVFEGKTINSAQMNNKSDAKLSESDKSGQQSESLFSSTTDIISASNVTIDSTDGVIVEVESCVVINSSDDFDVIHNTAIAAVEESTTSQANQGDQILSVGRKQPDSENNEVQVENSSKDVATTTTEKSDDLAECVEVKSGNHTDNSSNKSDSAGISREGDKIGDINNNPNEKPKATTAELPNTLNKNLAATQNVTIVPGKDSNEQFLKNKEQNAPTKSHNSVTKISNKSFSDESNKQEMISCKDFNSTIELKSQTEVLTSEKPCISKETPLPISRSENIVHVKLDHNLEKITTCVSEKLQTFDKTVGERQRADSSSVESRKSADNDNQLKYATKNIQHKNTTMADDQISKMQLAVQDKQSESSKSDSVIVSDAQVGKDSINKSPKVVSSSKRSIISVCLSPERIKKIKSLHRIRQRNSDSETSPVRKLNISPKKSKFSPKKSAASPASIFKAGLGDENDFSSDWSEGELIIDEDSNAGSIEFDEPFEKLEKENLVMNKIQKDAKSVHEEIDIVEKKSISENKETELVEIVLENEQKLNNVNEDNDQEKSAEIFVGTAMKKETEIEEKELDEGTEQNKSAIMVAGMKNKNLDKQSKNLGKMIETSEAEIKGNKTSTGIIAENGNKDATEKNESSDPAESAVKNSKEKKNRLAEIHKEKADTEKLQKDNSVVSEEIEGILAESDKTVDNSTQEDRNIEQSVKKTSMEFSLKANSELNSESDNGVEKELAEFATENDPVFNETENFTTALKLNARDSPKLSLPRLNSYEMRTNFSVTSNNEVINIRPESLEEVIKAKRMRMSQGVDDKKSGENFFQSGLLSVSNANDKDSHKRENIIEDASIVQNDKTGSSSKEMASETNADESPSTTNVIVSPQLNFAASSKVSPPNGDKEITIDDFDIIETIPHRPEPTCESFEVEEACCDEYDNMYFNNSDYFESTPNGTPELKLSSVSLSRSASQEKCIPSEKTEQKSEMTKDAEKLSDSVATSMDDIESSIDSVATSMGDIKSSINPVDKCDPGNHEPEKSEDIIASPDFISVQENKAENANVDNQNTLEIESQADKGLGKKTKRPYMYKSRRKKLLFTRRKVIKSRKTIEDKVDNKTAQEIESKTTTPQSKISMKKETTDQVKRKTPIKLGYNVHAHIGGSDIIRKRRKLVKKDESPGKITPKKPAAKYSLLCDSSSDETEEIFQTMKLIKSPRRSTGSTPDTSKLIKQEQISDSESIMTSDADTNTAITSSNQIVTVTSQDASSTELPKTNSNQTARLIENNNTSPSFNSNNSNNFTYTEATSASAPVSSSSPNDIVITTVRSLCAENNTSTSSDIIKATVNDTEKPIDNVKDHSQPKVDISEKHGSDEPSCLDSEKSKEKENFTDQTSSHNDSNNGDNKTNTMEQDKSKLLYSSVSDIPSIGSSSQDRIPTVSSRRAKSEGHRIKKPKSTTKMTKEMPEFETHKQRKVDLKDKVNVLSPSTSLNPTTRNSTEKDNFVPPCFNDIDKEEESLKDVVDEIILSTTPTKLAKFNNWNNQSKKNSNSSNKGKDKAKKREIENPSVSDTDKYSKQSRSNDKSDPKQQETNKGANSNQGEVKLEYSKAAPDPKTGRQSPKSNVPNSKQLNLNSPVSPAIKRHVLHSSSSIHRKRNARMGNWRPRKMPTITKFSNIPLPYKEPERVSKVEREQNIYRTMQKLLNMGLIFDQKPRGMSSSTPLWQGGFEPVFGEKTKQARAPGTYTPPLSSPTRSEDLLINRQAHRTYTPPLATSGFSEDHLDNTLVSRPVSPWSQPMPPTLSLSHPKESVASERLSGTFRKSNGDIQWWYTHDRVVLKPCSVALRRLNIEKGALLSCRRPSSYIGHDG
ncbi:uncharacterized protein LOC120334029 isoform X1 [Styela clava]